jgi:tetraacyldisaccharide 4'-kinase
VTPRTPASAAGDEAVLLARRGDCPVMAGPDRIASARRLMEEGCDIIVSDDGLQHYRLRRDLEVAVIDGARRFGNGLCLPAGPLREPVSRLRTVTWRVTQGAPQPGEAGMQLVTQYFYRLDNPAERIVVDDFPPQAVHAVAGIGNPERFFVTLRALGFEVTAHPFPDHHAYSAADLDFGDDRPVLMTEKDAVKCQAFAGPRHWVLAVAAQPDQQLANDILNRLKELMRG